MNIIAYEKNFYLYKNKMPGNDPKLEWALDNATWLDLDALAWLNGEENSTENGISHSVLEWINENSSNVW